MRRLLLASALFTCSAYAQDTVRLRTVEVHERTAAFIKDQQGTTFDSLTLFKYSSRNVAELLNDNAPLFIKSYGNGSLSTVSIRGTSSVHTSVIWNGIPVNLQPTGDMDLSLISAGSFDRIRLVHGGSSSYFGSGSVGGNILLEDAPQFGKGSSIQGQTVIGSFGKQEHATTIRANSDNFSFKASVFLKEAKNDFSYTNPFTSEWQQRKLQHAAVKGKGINLSAYYKFKRSTLAAYSWFEDFNRDIPAAPYGSNLYPAKQADRNFRNMIEYKVVTDQWVLNAKAAVITGSLSYLDTVTKVNSKAESVTLFPELSFIRKIKQGTWFTGVNSMITESRNSNYSLAHSRTNVAFFTGYQLPFRRSDISLNIREDVYSDKREAFTFNASYSYLAGKNFRFFTSGGKTFRAPSLNDLYWIPGGNPMLASEKGWFTQAGGAIEHKSQMHHFTFTSTLFSNYIDNWIIWLPQTAVIWTPRNIKTVWSKGLEASMKEELRLDPFTIRLNATYSYTEARNESADDPSIVLHDQIIYIPYYTANGSFDISYKNISLRYAHVFIGGRYTASDHTAALPYFQLGSLRFDLKIPLKNHWLNIFASGLNLFDQHYQVIEQKPMPGRSFETGLTLYLFKN